MFIKRRPSQRQTNRSGDAAGLDVAAVRDAVTAAGNNRAILRGDIERQAPDSYLIHSGDMTSCDCKEGEPPWLIDFRKARIRPHEFAELRDVGLSVSPFSDVRIPITPPLPWVRMPLQRRATGFLTPRLSFLGFPWPTLDLPFFVPLGEAWDLTLTPGIDLSRRGAADVGDNGHGAAKFATRFRWHPRPHAHGSLALSWSEDRNSYRDRLEFHIRDNRSLGIHSFADTSIRWLSDDLISRDYRMTIAEQVTNYLPSHVALGYRSASSSVTAGAEFFLRLRNPISPTISGNRRVSNIESHEYELPQRGPMVFAILQPIKRRVFGTLSPFRIEGRASVVRTGPLKGPGADDAIYSMFSEVEVAIAESSSLLDYDLGIRLVGATETAPSSARSGRLGGILSSAIGTTVFRRFGDLTHVVSLTSKVSSLRRLDGPLGLIMPEAEGPSLRTFSHLSLRLSQALWKAASRLARLDIDVPFDFVTHRLLQASVELDVAATPKIGLFLRLKLAANDFVASHFGTKKQFPERVPATHAVLTLKPVSAARLRFAYHRASSRNESLYRERFELTGEPDWHLEHLHLGIMQPTRWVHSVSGNLTVGLGRRGSVSYGTAMLLPRPGGTTSDREPRRPFVNRHQLVVAYRSPCRCWGVSLNLSATDPRALPESRGWSTEEIRAQVTLSL